MVPRITRGITQALMSVLSHIFQPRICESSKREELQLIVGVFPRFYFHAFSIPFILLKAS